MRIADTTSGDERTSEGNAGGEAAIAAELLALLFAGLPRSLVITAINAAITAYLLRVDAPGAMVAVWLTGLLAVTALRLALHVHWRRHRARHPDRAWRLWFVGGAVAAGAMWGSSAILLLPSHSTTHQLFLGFMLAGMGAGAMTSLVFDRAAFSGFVVPAIIPYALVMVWQQTELQVAMGALACLFVLGILAGGDRFRSSIFETLKLRFEKEKLAVELRQQAEQQAETNRLLKIEIERASAAEAQMRSSSEAAVAASRAKSTFLANMSHEIRTPINGVLGMTDLLMRTSLDERQRQLASTLRSSGTMLLTIIEDVLDLSRIEAGKLQVVSQPFDPRRCCEEALELFRSQAALKGIELGIVVEDGLPGAMLGDADRTRQVVVNLLGNAVKFTSSGSVEVRVRRTSDAGGEPRLEISVVDTGIGIEAAAIERIMRPFEQADGSTSRRYGGTGLGLAISKHLAELLGGSLRIASAPGKGTEVFFELPLRTIERRTRGRYPRRPRSVSGVCVLVAEDNPVNQLIAREYLEGLGCSVHMTENGCEALEAYRNGAFDIVLMDCQMPQMDGLAATRAIRQVEAETGRRRTPVVAVTANAFDEDRQRSHEAGMDAHLSKPYSAEELQMTIIRWTAPRDDSAASLAS